MAKVKLGNVSPGATALSRGRFLIIDGKFGPYAQKWPRQRGKAKTGYNYYRQAEFGIIGRMAANPYALDYGTAVEMVKGTTLVPRDWLMQCAYATAYEVVNPDGTIWPRYRDLAPNPQYVLDLITEEVGSIIYRAEIGWIGLSPTEDGFVLTLQDGVPTWVVASGGTPPDIQALLDSITSDPGSLLFRADDQWIGLPPGSPGQILTLDADGAPIWLDPPYVPPPVPPASTVSTPFSSTVAVGNATPVYSAITLGPAAENRLIVVAVTATRSAAIGARNLLGVTLNGAAMTPIVANLQVGSMGTVGLYYLRNDGDLTGEVQLTFDATPSAAAIRLYSLPNCVSLAPDDSATATGANPSAPLDNAVNGVVIGAAISVTGTVSATTWTGVAKDLDFKVNTVAAQESFASVAILPAQTGISYGITNTATTAALALASFH